MRVSTTTAGGPVDALPQDLVDIEFSHIVWTNFSGQARRMRIVPELLIFIATHFAYLFGATGLSNRRLRRFREFRRCTSRAGVRQPWAQIHT
jgi:hypothetical protein